MSTSSRVKNNTTKTFNLNNFIKLKKAYDT
jgi:hypothetical protein